MMMSSWHHRPHLSGMFVFSPLPCIPKLKIKPCRKTHKRRRGAASSKRKAASRCLLDEHGCASAYTIKEASADMATLVAEANVNIGQSLVLYKFHPLTHLILQLLLIVSISPTLFNTSVQNQHQPLLTGRTTQREWRRASMEFL